MAERAGVNVQTLRYYERRGLLPRPRAEHSGHRRYGPEAVQLVRFVKRAQSVGFQLEEIQELLQLRSEPDLSCRDVRDRVQQKRDEIVRRRRDLEAIQAHLDRLLERCEGQDQVRDCSILQDFDQSER